MNRITLIQRSVPLRGGVRGGLYLYLKTSNIHKFCYPTFSLLFF